MTDLGSRDPDGSFEVLGSVDVEEGCRCGQRQPVGLSERADHDCCREVGHAAGSGSDEVVCCRDGSGSVACCQGLGSSARHRDHSVHVFEGPTDEFE